MPFPGRLPLASLLAAVACSPMSSPPSTPETSPTAARLTTAIDSIVSAEVLGHGITGVSIVIARGSAILFERQWGLADVEAKRPVDASTTYRLGSMSKQFTAALLLKQVDRRKLALTDTIGRYLTGLKPEWTGLTIEQLLNHTAGVPRDFRDPSRAAENLPADSLIAMATRANATTAPPGSTFTYSNTGYMLLGALVEKLYAKPFGQVVREEIAHPLGLRTLAWCGDRDATAKAYRRAANVSVEPAPYMHPSLTLGNGGLCSNAADIARWNRALHGGKVLSPASYAAMTTPRGVAARRASPYGFGLYIRETLGGGTVIVHDGATWGYSGENVWYRAESLSVTMLYNSSPQLGADLNLTEVMGRIALGRAEGSAR